MAPPFMTSRAGSWRVWLAPAGLLALCTIPVVAGVARVAMLAAGAPVTPDNARFFAGPLSVVLHVVAATTFGVLGALQFAAPLRRWRSYHRRAGRVVAFAGLTTALTGLWMTVVYPRAPGDSAAMFGIRMVVGSVTLSCVVLGFAAIRRRDFAHHAAWMTRGYALGLGAGTQALVHLPWLVSGRLPGAIGHTILMAAAWALNAAIAEWAIRRRGAAPLSSSAVIALER